jgi:hypothetical protein
MKITCCLLLAFYCLAPLLSARESLSPALEKKSVARFKFGLKEKIGLYFAVKKHLKNQRVAPGCDTLLLSDGSLLYGKIEQQIGDVYKIKPCGDSANEARYISRSAVVKILYDKTPKVKVEKTRSKRDSPWINRFSLIVGLISFLSILLPFVFEGLFIGLVSIGIIAGVLAIFAIIMGLIGQERPGRKAGIAGIIFGLLTGMALLIVAVIAIIALSSWG